MSKLNNVYLEVLECINMYGLRIAKVKNYSLVQIYRFYLLSGFQSAEDLFSINTEKFY